MKITNVIIKNANLNVLKSINNDVPIVEGEYKGYQAPCVVFEDGDLVYAVAKTISQYYELLNKTPAEIFDDLKLKLLKQVQEKSNEQYEAFVSKYPDVEQKSFEKKAEEAYKVSADRTLALSETRYLTDLTGGLENSTIELRNALADAVNAKTVAMAQLETWGVLKRAEIENATLETINDIEI